jgi:antitoxin YefM
MAMPAERMSLAQAKSHLSEVIDDVETEHRRVVITKHGKPAAVLMSTEDLEALEDTLDLLSDPAALASLRRAEKDFDEGRIEYLSRDDARKRWAK